MFLVGFPICESDLLTIDFIVIWIQFTKLNFSTSWSTSDKINLNLQSSKGRGVGHLLHSKLEFY